MSLLFSWQMNPACIFQEERPLPSKNYQNHSKNDWFPSSERVKHFSKSLIICIIIRPNTNGVDHRKIISFCGGSSFNTVDFKINSFKNPYKQIYWSLSEVNSKREEPGSLNCGTYVSMERKLNLHTEGPYLQIWEKMWKNYKQSKWKVSMANMHYINIFCSSLGFLLLLVFEPMLSQIQNAPKPLRINVIDKGPISLG